ncbi:sigma 54-interacting transcriptional regulator [Clostridium aestuarii]|uniref:Sigma 54-interacting transcriptional regulator n=1 Tax=Clostridium aestuarii TaxID=338193 RepID=A0ABT4CXZ9_9CLOT|nr:sigma 54-interacting transcriptional regulator [Clostridium aestuarii]MCY6483851.1 sigma 54-interacting transcriptional regulator [Clostridium aestuarii]
MRKRLGIITYSKKVGIEYKNQVSKVFNDTIDIFTYSFETNNVQKIKEVDAVLISTYSQYEVLKKYIDNNVEVIIPKLTLSKNAFNMLKDSKIDKTAMLVNQNFEMCIETIATLYQLGFDEYELIPVYPNMNKILNLKTAIITGERNLVPDGVDKILDLGYRVFDKNTIVDIAIGLNLEDALTEKRMSDYFEQIVSYDKGVEFLISKSKTQKNQFNTLLSIMEKGVIGVNEKCIIENFNKNARKIIGKSIKYIGTNVNEILPELGFKEFFKTKKPILNKLIKINGNNITLSIFPVSELSTNKKVEVNDGAYAIIESFESQENTQNILRLQLANKGHVAKYSVDNIIGKSGAIEEVKKLVLRMGNSKSSVLITGESGTGKELVAQALHNASPIKEKQFVAINCAALSSNLLESELFGYESGAFTGALKGGKSGIFELAHKGTLFLDEIGEMPLESQVKLLRVIQEGEVMRVGGNKVIKVNVRIIAATNRNLFEQVEKGLFRKDLYYRLNVLPINIPSLRERVEDISILFEHFKRENNFNFEISSEVMEFLESYNWHGNIRELKNCIEYFDNIGTNLITLEHLPFHMKQYLDVINFKKTSETISKLNKRETFVLKLFYDSFKNRVKLGRRSISEKAFENNIHLSEYDVRKILNDLKNYGYINVEVGRGGSTITKEGIKLIEE